MLRSIVTLALAAAAIQAVDAGHPAQRHADMMRGKRAGAADGSHHNGANPCKRKESSSSHLESRSDSRLSIFSTSERVPIDFVPKVISASASGGNVVTVGTSSQNSEPLFKPVTSDAIKSPAAGFQVVSAPALFTPSAGGAMKVIHSWAGNDVGRHLSLICRLLKRCPVVPRLELFPLGRPDARQRQLRGPCCRSIPEFGWLARQPIQDELVYRWLGEWQAQFRPHKLPGKLVERTTPCRRLCARS